VVRRKQACALQTKTSTRIHLGGEGYVLGLAFVLNFLTVEFLIKDKFHNYGKGVKNAT
jgi:hypothetical protein